MDDSLVYIVSTQRHLPCKVFIMLFPRLASRFFPDSSLAHRYELQSHCVRINCLIFLKIPCIIRSHVLLIFESSVFCLLSTMLIEWTPSEDSYKDTRQVTHVKLSTAVQVIFLLVQIPSPVYLCVLESWSLKTYKGGWENWAYSRKTIWNKGKLFAYNHLYILIIGVRRSIWHLSRDQNWCRIDLRGCLELYFSTMFSWK